MCISAISPLEEHQVLLSDLTCQGAFEKIIEQNVKSGDVVLDLGCGTGIHTLMALKAGAKKVYSIEINPMIEIAREVIANNGFQDRVEFLMGDSLQLELPEKVDVIISNLGFLGSLENLPHAFKKFLKPNGIMIPDSAQMHFSPVNEEAFYKRMVNFWEQQPLGFDFSALRKMATNHPFYFKIKSLNSKNEIVDLAPIQYTNPQNLYSWTHELTQAEDATVHGWLGWYDFCLSGESFISTMPGSQLHPDLWSHIYLPLENPIDLKSGDKIQFDLSMSNKLAPDGPIWRWKTTLNGKLLFDQCTFKAMPLSDQILNKLAH